MIEKLPPIKRYDNKYGIPNIRKAISDIQQKLNEVIETINESERR